MFCNYFRVMGTLCVVESFKFKQVAKMNEIKIVFDEDRYLWPNPLEWPQNWMTSVKILPIQYKKVYAR